MVHAIVGVPLVADRGVNGVATGDQRQDRDMTTHRRHARMEIVVAVRQRTPYRENALTVVRLEE
jgi:hypothetical protein